MKKNEAMENRKKMREKGVKEVRATLVPMKDTPQRRVVATRAAYTLIWFIVAALYTGKGEGSMISDPVRSSLFRHEAFRREILQ